MSIESSAEDIKLETKGFKAVEPLYVFEKTLNDYLIERVKKSRVYKKIASKPGF
jgi:hypothetical protein